MATRKPPTELATDSAEAPAIMPPGGVEADVQTTVKYRRVIDPDSVGANQTSFDELAASEFPEVSDPLSDFLNEFANYAGYPLTIVRLPDPAGKRFPGSAYARPNLSEIENLGDAPFDPDNFVVSLQMLNGYSGGVFRVFLKDPQTRQLIPGARLDRIAIPDPPRGSAGAHNQTGSPGTVAQPGYAPAPPAKEREQSPIEKKMVDLQTRLLETALERALNPAPPPPTPPINPLSQEDQIALMLISRGDLLGSAIQRVTALVQAPENAAKESNWKEKLMDVASQNPAIVERVSSTLERIVNRILPAPDPQPRFQPQPQSQPRASTVADNMPSETPGPEPLDDDQGDEEMAMLDSMFALLNSNKPLTQDDPVFTELRTAHPIKFPLFIRMIAAAPLETIIDYVKQQSPLYDSLLTSETTGAHLQGRIKELQALCIEALKPQAAPAAPAPES